MKKKSNEQNKTEMIGKLAKQDWILVYISFFLQLASLFCYLFSFSLQDDVSADIQHSVWYLQLLWSFSFFELSNMKASRCQLCTFVEPSYHAREVFTQTKTFVFFFRRASQEVFYYCTWKKNLSNSLGAKGSASHSPEHSP